MGWKKKYHNQNILIYPPREILLLDLMWFVHVKQAQAHVKSNGVYLNIIYIFYK